MSNNTTAPTHAESVEPNQTSHITRTGQSPALLIPLIALTIFGFTMAPTTVALISLALRLSTIAPADITTQLSLILGIGTIVGLVALILTGQFSDVTRSRLGMRRPWIIAGTVGVIAGTAVLYYGGDLVSLWIGYALLSLGGCVGMAAVYGVMSDQVEPKHQGIAGGTIGGATVAALVGGLFIVQLAPDNLFVIFVVPGICATVPALLLIVLLRDRKLNEKIPLTFRKILATFTVNVRKSPSLGWLLPTIALIQFAQLAVGTYSYFLIGAQLTDNPDAVPTAVFIATLISCVVSFITSIFVGAISDRIGRRKPFLVLAAGMFVIGALIAAFASSLIAIYIAFGVTGLGVGIFLGTYLALGLETMNDPETTAHDINVVVVVGSLASVIVPLIGPLLLGPNGDNFPLLLVVSAAVTTVSLLFLLKVKAR